jgi:hypothetical protein
VSASRRESRFKASGSSSTRKARNWFMPPLPGLREDLW